jgi:transposase
MRMSQVQWRKLDVMERVERGEFTVSEAAQALGLSRRQAQRLRKRVLIQGAAGVIHGNTGRSPRHKIADYLRDRVLELWSEKYAGFNDQHFTEKLDELEGIRLSRQTVRRVLRAAGIGSIRKRRPAKHRRRRDRRPQAGQMILWDGSRHDWLEGRGPRLCLMAAIDDATGELLPGAHFVEQECALGYLRVLREIVYQKGAPLSAYMDRHGILRRNDKNWSREEQLAGKQEPTQVRRVLDDLGVETIYALSPQAKGRVERLWGTLQDRLVSELRLAGATDARSANRVLAQYRVQHNARFAIPPENSNAAWRPCPPGFTVDEICSFQYIRVVQNNNTVRIGSQIIDIPKSSSRATFAKAAVIVRHLLKGGYRVYFKGELIARAKGPPAIEPNTEPRTLSAWTSVQQRRTKKRAMDGVTESLAC